MPERKIVEFGDEYTELCKHLENLLNLVSLAYCLSWKTPKHDIVVRIMNEIVELEKVEI